MFSGLVLAKLAVALTLIASAFGQPRPKCARSYTVKDGDYCNKISAEHQVSTFQLSYVNPKIDSTCSNIYPGDDLCLGTEGNDCSNVHVVKVGDDCITIAYEAGIRYELLLHNNPNINDDCSNIYGGEVLCTGDSTYNYPTHK